MNLLNFIDKEFLVMAVAEDVREILRRMPEAFVPEKAAGVDALIQLNLTGEGGGAWQIKIANGQISVQEGEAASSDLALTMDTVDYVALSKGEVNPMNLFLGGKIKLQGNMTLAMKFQEMFDRNRVA
jgi:putative sterol carrier protein